MVRVFNFNNVVKVEGLATQRSRASTFAYPVLIELGLLVVVAFLNTAADAGRVVPIFDGDVAAGLAPLRPRSVACFVTDELVGRPRTPEG